MARLTRGGNAPHRDTRSLGQAQVPCRNRQTIPSRRWTAHSVTPANAPHAWADKVPTSTRTAGPIVQLKDTFLM